AAGGAAPGGASLLGRDYVGAGAGNPGPLPAFDSAAHADHDGYLSDAENARRAPGHDARFLYESRLFYPRYGRTRFLASPPGPAYRAWAVDYASRLLTANPLASALFVDNSAGTVPGPAPEVVEPIAAYATDYAGLLNAVGRAVAPKWILAN